MHDHVAVEGCAGDQLAVADGLGREVYKSLGGCRGIRPRRLTVKQLEDDVANDRSGGRHKVHVGVVSRHAVLHADRQAGDGRIVLVELDGGRDARGVGGSVDADHPGVEGGTARRHRQPVALAQRGDECRGAKQKPAFERLKRRTGKGRVQRYRFKKCGSAG